MRSLWRKKDLYVAKFISDELDDDGNTIRKYDKPVYIGKENIQPLGSSGALGGYGIEEREFGSRVTRMQKVLFDYDKYLDTFKENDLAYLDGATPQDEVIHGDNANYRIASVRAQNRKVVVYFEKLPNK
jgi:hypothetical protein